MSKEEACPREELIAGYLAQDLSPSEEAQLEAHLRGCGVCRATLDGNRAVGAALRSLPLPAPSEEARSRAYAAVLAAMEAKSNGTKTPASNGKIIVARVKPRSNWIVAVTGLLAAACLLLVLDLSFRSPSPSPEAGPVAIARAPAPAEAPNVAKLAGAHESEHGETMKGDSVPQEAETADRESFAKVRADAKEDAPNQSVEESGKRLAAVDRQETAERLKELRKAGGHSERQGAPELTGPAKDGPQPSKAEEPPTALPAGESSDQKLARRTVDYRACMREAESLVAEVAIDGNRRPQAPHAKATSEQESQAGAEPGNAKTKSERAAGGGAKPAGEPSRPAPMAPKDSARRDQDSKKKGDDEGATAGASAPGKTPDVGRARMGGKDYRADQQDRSRQAAAETGNVLAVTEDDACRWNVGAKNVYLQPNGQIAVGPATPDQQNAGQRNAGGYAKQDANQEKDGTEQQVASVNSLNCVLASPTDAEARRLTLDALDQLAAEPEHDLRWARRVLTLGRFLGMPEAKGAIERVNRLNVQERKQNDSFEAPAPAQPSTQAK